jgi:hypothetical protein
MTDAVVVTSGLTLDMVKAVDFVATDLPVRLLPPWVSQSLCGLLCRLQDDMLSRPAIGRDDLAWKMGVFADLQGCEEAEPDLPRYAAILRDDLARLLPADTTGDQP